MKYWITLASALLFASSALAEKSAQGSSIRLNQVIEKVLQHNPQIRAGDIEAQAAFTRVLQKNQTSPLFFNIEVENFAGGDSFAGSNSLETTLSFARVLELGGKPVLRGNVARQQALLLQNNNDAKKLDLLAEATRRFIDILVDQHRLDIAQNRMALIEKKQTIVAKRVRLGKSPRSESRRIKIELERAKIGTDDIKHELKASRLQLSSLWGELEPAFNNVQASLFELDTPVDFSELQALLQRNPDLAQFATQERLAAARVSLARSRRKQDIEISGGIRHHNASSDLALVLSASIPFGTTTRAKPYEDEAQLLSQVTPFDLEQQRNALYASLFALNEELKHSHEAVELLRDVIIPEADQVLRDYQRGYEAGRYSLLELNDVQTTLLEVQSEAVVEASKYHRNKIEIERLTGMHMSRAEERK